MKVEHSPGALRRGLCSRPGAADLPRPASSPQQKSPRRRLRQAAAGRRASALRAVRQSVPADAGEVSGRPAAIGGACGATPRLAAAGCAKACRPRRWQFTACTSRRTVHRHATRPRYGASTPRLKHAAASGGKGRSRLSLGYWPCPRLGASRCSRHAGMPSWPRLLSGAGGQCVLGLL